MSVSEEGTLEESILASGNFVYRTNVQIRSEVTGRVIEVLVDEGQYVEKGEVLMRLTTVHSKRELLALKLNLNPKRSH